MRILSKLRKAIGTFDMKKMVICATQRCGSTMLVEDMRNSEVLGQPEEWFLSWSGKPVGTDWRQEFEDVIAKGSGGNSVHAVKVMANQIFDIDRKLATAFGERQGGFAPNFFAAYEDATWISIVRNDFVAQAISRVIARQTNIYHATGSSESDHFAGNLMRGYKSDYNAEAEYDFQAIMKEVFKIQLENMSWERFFSAHNVIPVRLVYEEISQYHKDLK